MKKETKIGALMIKLMVFICISIFLLNPILFASNETENKICNEFIRIANWVNSVANTVNDYPTAEIGDNVQSMLLTVASKLEIFFIAINTSKYLNESDKKLGSNGILLVKKLKNNIESKHTDSIVLTLDKITDTIDKLAMECKLK